MAPILVNSYTVTGTALGTLTTSAFTPSDGEVIVVKHMSENQGQTTPGTPTGGSLTYTQRAVHAGASACEAHIWTAVVGTSPGSMSVTVTQSGGGGAHSMTVERWSSAGLAGTPAFIQTTQGAGTAPSVTITTTGAGSVVSWAIGDWSASAPGTRAYRSSATEEGLHDASPGSYVAYFAWQSAPTAGSQTVGMTAPTQQPTIVAVEILDAAVPYNPPTGMPPNDPVSVDSVAQPLVALGYRREE